MKIKAHKGKCILPVKNLSHELTIFNRYKFFLQTQFPVLLYGKAVPNMTTFTFQIYCHERT